MALLHAELRNDPQTLGGLFHELRMETGNLVRQEIELARTELREKAEHVARNSVLIAIGAVIAIPAFGLALWGAASGVSHALIRADVSPAIAGWLPHLVLGLVVIGIAYGLIQKGVSALRGENMMPQKTAATLRENKEWIARKVG